jgi:predicted MFS family arabinose efflux permease
VSSSAEPQAPPPEVAAGRLIVSVLLPFALGYLMTYLQRAVPAVVAPDLERDLGLSASALGLSMAAYPFAYAVGQLPVGVLLDRFGPRRVQAALFCLSAIGSALFAFAPGATVLTLARGLIGLGFAGGLMGSFKLIALWVPRERIALANGCLMSFGGLGALAASTPMDFAARTIGWRATFLVLTLATAAIAAWIFLVVPERRTPAAEAARPSGGLAGIFRDRVFWKLAPVVATTTGSALAIQTLWSGPWLHDVGRLDRGQVATRIMATALGFTLGVAMSGALTGFVRRFHIGLLTVMSWGVAVSLAAQAVLVSGLADASIVVWTVFGVTGQIAILAYAWVSEHYGVASAGRANTALNVLAFATAFAAQYAIGGIVDLWPGPTPGSYQATGYRVAFGACVAVQALCFLWYLLPRRTARS